MSPVATAFQSRVGVVSFVMKFDAGDVNTGAVGFAGMMVMLRAADQSPQFPAASPAFTRQKYSVITFIPAGL